jgi:uncharacterized protein (TIGR02300 family)
MKLEWGRKICCPACSLPFYDMQRSSVVCPSCGRAFEALELFTRGPNQQVVDRNAVDVDVLVTTDFRFEEDESENSALAEDPNELLVKAEIDDMKLVDEE